MNDLDEKFMMRAMAIAQDGVDSNHGGPFGCVIAKDGQIIGEGCNRVTSTNDPTAHAEIVAIRDACNNLRSFQLEGCVVYTTCEPCPMCLGAIYWARPAGIFFAGTREDAAAAGFDDKLFYDEFEKPNENRHLKMANLLRGEAQKLFYNWTEKTDKTIY